MRTTDFQNKVLNCIEQDYKTCDDIAFEIGSYKMIVGNSVKSLVNKGLVQIWYDSETNIAKYIKR